MHSNLEFPFYHDHGSSRLAIVLESTNFILESNEIEDFEFSSRIGVERPTLAQVIERLSDVRDVDSDTIFCINNCLNEVCNAVGISDAEWNLWFSYSKDEVR